MENLNLEKFNPQKSELITIVNGYKDLTINGIDDKEGYLAVHKSRMELKKIRVNIQNTGKELRADAIKFQKSVIDKEKEFIAIIEPVEQELADKEMAIDIQKERAKRLETLPQRVEMLGGIEIKLEDDFVLLMDDNKFSEFYNQKKGEYLQNKELKLKAEADRLEAEQKKADEDKKNAEIAKEAERKAVEDGIKQAELAKLKAEEDKIKAVQEAERKAEEAKKQAIEAERKKAADEKAAILAEQKRKDDERLEAERKAKEEKQKAIDEQNELDKKKKYQKFLLSNGYSEKYKAEFYIAKENNKIILYKKVGEFIL
jgi:hypothetical protein